MSLYLRLGYDRMSTVIQLNFDYEQIEAQCVWSYPPCLPQFDEISKILNLSLCENVFNPAQLALAQASSTATKT